MYKSLKRYEKKTVKLKCSLAYCVNSKQRKSHLFLKNLKHNLFYSGSESPAVLGCSKARKRVNATEKQK